MEEPQPIYSRQMTSPSSKAPAAIAVPEPPATSYWDQPLWLHSEAERSQGNEIVPRAHTASRSVTKNSDRPRQPTRASSLSSQACETASSTSPRPGPSLSPFQYLDESPENPQDGITLSGTTAVNGASDFKNALSERFGGTAESQQTMRRLRDYATSSKTVVHNVAANTLAEPTDYSVVMPANLKADGVWTAGQSTDFTMHLTFDVQDDIEDALEGFSHWHQIGSFKNARKYFTQKLEEHMNNPYVLVHYMEMLLDQGHYLAVKPFCQRIIHFLELPDSSRGQNADKQFLKVYAELVAAFAASHGPCQIENLADTFDSAMMNLDLITWGRIYQGGSTEIRLMSTLFRFRSRFRPEVNEAQFSKLFEWAGRADGLKTILIKLLRDGRVWDMCFLVKSVAEANCLGLSPDEIVEWLNELVLAWKPSQDDDVATRLALLDLLVFIAADPLCFHYRKIQSGILELAGPLAETISQNHPEYMKSRPYVRWILARVSCRTRFSEEPLPSLHSHTRPYDGLSYDWDTDMPIYIPTGTENPGWKQTGAMPGMLELTRLALNTALETEDYKTEAVALQTLINLSENPDEEFEELCYLQKAVQGDIESYMETLISKYLICKTDEAKDQLRKDILEQISLPTFENSFSGGLTWLSNMLFSTLESDEQQASAARDRADKCWFRLEPDLRQAIIQKPHLTGHLYSDRAIDIYLGATSQPVHKEVPTEDSKEGNMTKEPELAIDKNSSDAMQPNMGHHSKTIDSLAENIADINHSVTIPEGVAQGSTSSFRKTDKPEMQRSVRFDQEDSSHENHVHRMSRKTKRKDNELYTTDAEANTPAYKEKTEPPADGVVSTQMDSPSTVLAGNEDKRPALSNIMQEDGEKEEDKEEVMDNPWNMNRRKPKKKSKETFSFGAFDEEKNDKTEEPAPTEEKKNDDLDFAFNNSKKGGKRKKKTAQKSFSWDEPENKLEEALEPLVASQDRESTKAGGFGTWGTSWDTGSSRDWDATTNTKAKEGIEEPDSPADAIPSDENWSIGVPKKIKKKKKMSTFSWGDEPEEPAPEPVEPLEQKEKRTEEDFWGTSSTKKQGKKGENIVEEKEPDPPASPEPEETKDDDDRSSWDTKKRKKKTREKIATFTRRDESIDSERQPSAIKAEDGDESGNAPSATHQTRWPLQEVESPRPGEESARSPARRRSF